MKGKILTLFKEYLILTIASFIFAAAWECFMIPNGMSAGGMMGLCTIIQYATGDLIPAQVSYIAINAVLMVIAVLAMGIGFGFKTIYCIVVSTLAMSLISGIEVLHSMPGEFLYIDEKVLVPIFAGVLEAVGIGLILRYGGSTGIPVKLAVLLGRKAGTLFKHAAEVGGRRKARRFGHLGDMQGRRFQQALGGQDPHAVDILHQAQVGRTLEQPRNIERAHVKMPGDAGKGEILLIM